ncbi:MAG: ATP-binding protein [bacterium]|nr:ATP-binding protein [bacterium]
MKINVGHAVAGENFFGREKELERMEEIWENKAAGIFIPGPRRIGKTSLVKEFIRRNKERLKVIYFDLEGRHSISEMCKDLLKEIDSNFPGFVKSKNELKGKWNTLTNMLKEIEIAGVIKVKTGLITPSVKEMTERMEEVLDVLYKNNFIIALDEFSDFLLNLKRRSVDEVKYFLEWLRRLRQQEKIRLIVTGSINIMSTVEELKLPYLINDMTDIEILSLTPKEIRTLLTELLKGKQITLSPPVLEYAASRLSDGIPFYVQLFADGLAFYTGGGKNIDKIEDIEALYHDITGKQHKEFVDLHSRLRNHLPKEHYEAARKILAHTCRDGMSMEDLFPIIRRNVKDKETVNKLLKRLTDECYLTKSKGRYRFVSPMLADWWNNQYDWER